MYCDRSAGRFVLPAGERRLKTGKAYGKRWV